MEPLESPSKQATQRHLEFERDNHTEKMGRRLRSRRRCRRGSAAIEAVMIMVFLLGAGAFLAWSVYGMYRESFLIILSWQQMPY